MKQFRMDNFTLDKFEKTSNGFLNISGYVTRNGIFKYEDANELRSYDEVFNPESLKTMFAVPVSWEHPPDLLTPVTIPIYQKGLVASEPVIEKIDEKISAVRLDNIIIQDPALIDWIIKNDENEPIQFSMGYSCDIIPQRGTFDGIDYSRVQKNIVYNHLAVVKDARCGSICSIIPKEESVKYKKDCACGHYKKDGEKEVVEEKKEEVKKEEEPKKDAEVEVEAPAWVKKMIEQHDKMLEMLGKMVPAESEEEDCMDEEDEPKSESEPAAEKKSVPKEKKPKEEDEDEDLYDKKDKRKDSVTDVVTSFKFGKDKESKKDSDSSFKPYNRDEFAKQLFNKGAK